MSIPSKVRVDFECIPTFNPETLIVGDTSSWGVAENQAAYILITPPGSTSTINNVFQKERLNIFNSVNLGLSCLTECDEQVLVDLADGVWTIKVQSAYTNLDKTRYFLKTDRFRLELDKIYIKAGLEFDRNNKQLREDLLDIEFLQKSAEAHTRNGDFYKADRDFTQAKDLLRKYSDCINCI